MITAVDTNVLLDIFGADPGFGRASAEVLRRCFAEGAVVACEVVWTETAAVFSDEPQFLAAMETLGIGYSATTEDAALTGC